MKKENIIKYLVIPFEIVILFIVGRSFFQTFEVPPELPEDRFWVFLFLSSFFLTLLICSVGYFFGKKFTNYQDKEYKKNIKTPKKVSEKIITLILIYTSIFGILKFSIYLFLIILIPYQVLSIFKVITIPLPIFILITICIFIIILVIELILIFVFGSQKEL